MMTKQVSGYLYKNANPKWCQARVWHRDIYGPRQCTRNVREIIEGHGFCNQHATKIKKDLGLFEKNRPIYIVDLGPIRPVICRGFIVKETEFYYWFGREFEIVYPSSHKYFSSPERVGKKDQDICQTIDQAFERLDSKLVSRLMDLKKSVSNVETELSQVRAARAEIEESNHASEQ